jgi:hypothetical protein
MNSVLPNIKVSKAELTDRTLEKLNELSYLLLKRSIPKSLKKQKTRKLTARTIKTASKTLRNTH